MGKAWSRDGRESGDDIGIDSRPASRTAPCGRPAAASGRRTGPQELVGIDPADPLGGAPVLGGALGGALDGLRVDAAKYRGAAVLDGRARAQHRDPEQGPDDPAAYRSLVHPASSPSLLAASLAQAWLRAIADSCGEATRPPPPPPCGMREKHPAARNSCSHQGRCGIKLDDRKRASEMERDTRAQLAVIGSGPCVLPLGQLRHNAGIETVIL